jgi:hypothetical protein
MGFLNPVVPEWGRRAAPACPGKLGEAYHSRARRATATVRPSRHRLSKDGAVVRYSAAPNCMAASGRPTFIWS